MTSAVEGMALLVKVFALKAGDLSLNPWNVTRVRYGCRCTCKLNAVGNRDRRIVFACWPLG